MGQGARQAEEMRGTRKGVKNESYLLSGKMRDADGNLYESCCGTSRNGKRHYYYRVKSTGASMRKEDAEELADMKVIDIVHNVLLSFLDGGMNRVERDSAYYRLVTGTISIPSRIMKNNSLFRKLNECADAILTGSNPDPEDAII